jgi:hypothetical protein
MIMSMLKISFEDITLPIIKKPAIGAINHHCPIDIITAIPEISRNKNRLFGMPNVNGGVSIDR